MIEFGSRSNDTFKMKDPELFGYEKNKTVYVDRIYNVIIDFATYFDLNVINSSEIKSLAESSVKFGFALKRVCINDD